MEVSIKKQEQTPTQKIVEDSGREAIVTDSRGRKLVLKHPDWFVRSNFLGAVDKEKSENTAYLNSISPLMFLQSIDGIPVRFNKQLDIDGYLKQLGDAGFIAIVEYVSQEVKSETLEGEVEQIKK